MFSFQKKTENKGLTGVAWHGESVAIAHVRREAGVAELDVCEVLGGDDPDASLAAAIATQGLIGSPCVVVLPEDAYSLRLVNAPDVEPDEVIEAARWLVKDLIDFDVEEADIDVLDIPVDAGWTRDKKIYVLAVQDHALRRAVDRIEAAGLELAAVEIREHALLIAAGSESSTRGTAILQINGKNGILSIGEAGHLYVEHPVTLDPEQLEYGWENTSLDPDSIIPHEVDHLLLEIQRSLDYYESEFGRGPVSALLIAPSDGEVSSLVPCLQHNLSVDVRTFDLSEKIACKVRPSYAVQASALTAVGAALSDPDDSALQLHRIFTEHKKEVLSADAITRLVGFACAMIGLWYGVAWWQLRGAENVIAALNAHQNAIERRLEALTGELEVTTMQPGLAGDVASLDRRRDRSAHLLDALARLEAGKGPRFSAVLEALAQQPVTGLWLREIHLQESGRRFEFVGSSLQPGLLPRWLRQMEQEPAFAGATFEVLRMTRSDPSLPHLDFTLGANPEVGP